MKQYTTPHESFSRQKVIDTSVDFGLQDIERTFLTRRNGIGLGREAVQRSLHDTEIAIKLDDNPSFVQRFTRRIKDEEGLLMDYHTDAIRKSVNMLSPDLADEIFKQLEGTYMKDALLGHKAASRKLSEHENPLGALLSKKNILGKHVVANDTVLNFAQWHMGQTLEKQERLDTKIEELRWQYKQRIWSAVDEGWIPTNAIHQLGHLDDVDVLQDDMFTTDADNMTGWYHPGIDGRIDPAIALSPLEHEELNQEETLTHEWTHSLSNDHDAKYSRFRLTDELFGKYGGLVVNEALTEHLAQSLVHGDFETLEPDLRSSKGTYTSFRTFINAIHNKGLIKINIRETYDALFFGPQSSVDEFKKSEKVTNLMSKIDKSFPDLNIITRLQDLKDKNDFNNLLSEILTNAFVVAAEREQQDYQILSKAFQYGDEFEDAVRAKRAQVPTQRNT